MLQHKRNPVLTFAQILEVAEQPNEFCQTFALQETGETVCDSASRATSHSRQALSL